MIPELWGECRQLMGQLDEEMGLCRRSAVALAENERAYRTALAVEVLRLKRSGMPVTVIPDLARGAPEVADLRCARDCSEAVYKASCEAINVLKLKLRTVNEEITREWNSGDPDTY